MKSLNLRVCLVLSIAAFTAQVATAATVPAGFTDSVVAAGLTNPSAMALANWKVPGAMNKTHQLQARAFDLAGNSATATSQVTAR